MSTGLTGTQSPTTNEKNHQVTGPEPQTDSRVSSEELTPDCPPHAPALEGSGSAPAKPKRPRGFAAMDRQLVSEIARKGGKAAHSAGTAHEFTSEEARVAGRKGGRATHAKRRRGSAEPHTPLETEKPGE